MGRWNRMNFMKDKHLPVLRPNQYDGDDLRLAFFEKDYQNYVKGHIELIFTTLSDRR